MHASKQVLAMFIVAAAAVAACTATVESGAQSADAISPDALLSLAIPQDVAPGRPLALQLPDGRRGWALRLEGGRPLGTPAVSGKRLYVGGGFGSFDFYAIDTATGNTLWRVRTTDDGPTGAVVYADLTIFNTESCTLEVRRTDDGALVWGRWLGDPLMSQPAVDDERVVVCYPRGGSGEPRQVGPVPVGTVARGGIPVEGEATHVLAGFELRTGRFLWARGVPGDCISAPVVENGVAHAATLDGTLTQIELATGRLISQEQRQATSAPWVAKKGDGWEVIVSQRETRPAAARDVSKTEHYEGLRRIDAATGRMSEEKQFFEKAEYLDRATVDGSAYFTAALKASADAAVGFAQAPAQANLGQAASNVGVSRVVDAWAFQGSRALVTGGRLYSTRGNKVTAGAADGGKLDWEFTYRPETSERLLSPPAAAGGQLVFTALDGAIFSVDKASGRLRHGFKLDRRIVSQPAVVGGRIFVGTLDGWLIALDTGDRALDGWTMWGGGPAHNGR